MQTFKISETGEGSEFTYPKVIGLAGVKGVGKSTFAYQIGGHVISLASPIKKMLEVIVPKIYIYEEKEADIPGFPDGVNARLLMQTLGTEWGRNLYPDIWLNFLLRRRLQRLRQNGQEVWIMRMICSLVGLLLMISGLRMRHK